MAAQTSLRSSRGAHDSGCGKAAARFVGLCAMTDTVAVSPATIVSDAGAVHVRTCAPSGGGRTAEIAGKRKITDGAVVVVVGSGAIVVPGAGVVPGTFVGAGVGASVEPGTETGGVATRGGATGRRAPTGAFAVVVVTGTRAAMATLDPGVVMDAAPVDPDPRATTATAATAARNATSPMERRRSRRAAVL